MTAIKYFWIRRCENLPQNTTNFLHRLSGHILIEIPWSWTHSLVLSNFISWSGDSLSYQLITARCLSKVHGLPSKILTTSFLLSKVKIILWSLKLWILKPFLALHSGVKVLAMTSMLMALLVRNLAAMENFSILSSSSKQPPGPSLSEIVSRFHDWAKSSILTLAQNCFPNPQKITQQA